MMIYNAAIVLHIVGITLMAGTSFLDFITFRAFANQYVVDNGKGLVLERYLYKLQRFLGIGMLLILVSGITMMAKMHEVWGAKLLFRIKMGLLLLVILNGLGLRSRMGKRLRKMTAPSAAVNAEDERWTRLKRSFAGIQLIQLFLFLLIFTLSVFKFN